MLLWLFRGAFAILLTAIALLAYSVLNEEVSAGVGIFAAVAILGLGGLILFTDLKEKNKQIGTVSAIYFGLLMGLLLGALLSFGVHGLLDASLAADKVKRVGPVLYVAITMICCFVTISILLQTRDDFRFIIPYVEFSKQIKGNKPLVLDTSVIIDGRIADLCDTRLVDSQVIVPRFVLQELQGIADSTDKLKRNRGRRGLDMLKRLQSNQKIELMMHDGEVTELRGNEKIRVDEKLVLFTKAINGKVVTNDFNLNKLAQLQGVDVINLNEVANSLKTVALPGEYLSIKIVKQGDQLGQGIGYLDDGTMVVVEQGRGLIGQETSSVLVTSVLQTPAGRMIFGRPEARPSGAFNPVSNAGMTSVASALSTTSSPSAILGNQTGQSTTTTQPVKTSNSDISESNKKAP